MNKKRIVSTALATSLIFAPTLLNGTIALADSFYTQETNAERADIINWVANTDQQIDSNMSAQNIDRNNLNGDRYVIQWGDTLSGISSVTGISVAKLAYDNDITNVNLIYAGDILILNRDGEVPTDYEYEGDGDHVAMTKVTINNISNDDHSVTIDNSVTKGNVTKQVFESPKDPVTDDDKDTNKDADDNSDKSDAKATKESSKEESSSKSDDTDAKDAKVLDEDEFSDAVNDELAKKLDLDDDEADEKLSVDFTVKDDEDTDSEDEDTNSEDTNSEDADTENEDTDSEDTDIDDADSEDTDSQDEDAIYDDDQDISIHSNDLTKKNAKKLADKIYKQLKKDDKLDKIKDADKFEFVIVSDDEDFTFNVNLTSDDEDVD